MTTNRMKAAFEILLCIYLVAASWFLFLDFDLNTSILLTRYLLPIALIMLLGLVLLFLTRENRSSRIAPGYRLWLWISTAALTLIAPLTGYISGIITVEQIRNGLDLEMVRIDYQILLLDDVFYDGNTSDIDERYALGYYHLTDSAESVITRLQIKFEGLDHWKLSIDDESNLLIHCDYSPDYVEAPGVFMWLDNDGFFEINVSRSAPKYCLPPWK